MTRALDSTTRGLVDPELFAQLDDLELIARTAVEGFLQGLHRSPFVGFSVEFASHREYLPGDDLRHLNWKLYGRQDRLYVKQYDAETNLDMHLVVDWSGSMATSSGPVSKRRYAACLAAALAHLALLQHDAVGLTLFGDRVIEHLKPRAKSNQLDEILTALAQTVLQARAPSAAVLHDVAELMPRRGLIALISDLFFEPAELLSALDHVRFQGHDVIVFHVLDELECKLPVDGPIRFEDLETGEEVVTQVYDIRPAYQAAIGRWFNELDHACMTREIDRVALTTNQPLERALHNYLSRREHHF